MFARLSVLAAALVQFASADLPIHCIHANVVGSWKFQATVNSHDDKELCGYNHPDLSKDHFSTYNYNFVQDHAFEVKLKGPNIVEDVSSGKPIGTWTMVYDEGFEMQIHGFKYFAFFRYEPNKGTDSSSDDEVADYTSFCSEIRVGWYHGPHNTGFGCYKGSRTDVEASMVQSNSQIHHQNIVSRMPTSGDDSLFEPDYAFVEMHNKDTTNKWQAKVHDQFLNKDMHHMHGLLGRRKYRKPISFAETGSRVMAHARKATTEQAQAVEGLPKNFDWRNVNGENYITPVKNQGSCGSCYAVAAMSVFEARARIKSKNTLKPDLSAQDILACSAYNQGCEGGYPFLVAKYGDEFGFTEEQCMPYEGSDSVQCGTNTCRDNPNKQDSVFYTTNYRYIGGYYGGCNAASMQKEIYDNGPVIVAFEAPGDLFYYTSGVFHGESPRSEPQVPSTNAMLQTEDAGEKFVNKWEQTNHAVLAVGWGVDTDDTPYWIIKNTWGPDWGENGYFRIKRGSDECGVESMAVTADLLLPGERQKKNKGTALLEEAAAMKNLKEMFEGKSVSQLRFNH